MNTLILRNADKIEIEIAPAAIEKRSQLFLDAVNMTRCESDLEQEIIVEMVRSLKLFSKETETFRVEIKRPILNAQRAIDDAARKLNDPVDVEVVRLQKLINLYEQHKQFVANAERERVRKEQEAVEKKAREEREAAEKAAKEAKTLEEQISASAKLEEAKQKQQAVVPIQAPAVAHKVSGTASREVWKFEVTDIKKLYETRPDLVRVEENRQAINREISVGIREIPGVKIWSEQELSVRT